MSDRDPLDDFLKRKLADRQHAFKESYWEAAAQLIEADRGKKRRKGFLIWWAGGLGTILILLLGIGLWSWFTPGNETYLASNDSSEQGANPSTIIIEVDSCPPSPVLSQQASSTPSSYSPPTPTPFPNTARSKSHVIASSHVATRKEVSNESDQKLSSSSSNDSNQVIEEVHDLATEEQTQLTEHVLRSKEGSELNAGTVYRLQAREFSLHHSIDKKIKGPTVSLQMKINVVGIRIALDAAEGLNNGGTSQGRSFLPFVGLHYARMLHPGFRLHSGIGYVQRGQLQSDHSYRTTNYGFGFETVSTTISPNKLHFLEVPLYGELKIKHRHSLLFGGSLLQLVNVSSQLTPQTQDDFGISNGQTETVWGYKQGFIPRDMSLMAGYKYYIGSGFYLDLRSQYGLRDLTEQDFWENQSFDRNVRVQIGLTYDFLNF